MSAGIIDDIAKGSTAVFAPITVQQYHDMISSGILLEGAPVELIDGLMVKKDRCDNVIEVYETPLPDQGRCQTCVKYHPGDEIVFLLSGREVRIAVSDLLG